MAALSTDDRGLIARCSRCGRRNRLQWQGLTRETRCAACKEPIAALSAPLDVPSSADFDRLITHASVPVVVDYWAEWCGPCRMVAPELVKTAARANDRFMIVKVDTEALTDVAQRHRIQSIPTLAVFAGGREIARTAGARPAADIEAFITQAIDAHSTRRA